MSEPGSDVVYRGVFPILATPFDDQEEVQLDELGVLVDWQIERGVSGLVCLGVASEAFRLDDAERARVAQLVMDRVDGRIPVIVGVTAMGTRIVERQARTAQDAGASGILLAPPPVPNIGLEPILDYYTRVGAAAPDVVVVVQDEPNATGVRMPADLVARIIDTVPNARAAKIEDPPTGRKIHRIKAASNRQDAIAFFGGLGGQYLLAELAAGSAGAMTGFAYPEVLRDICERYWAGDESGARDVFYRYLPLMQFEFQPVLGMAVRKAILRHRGVLTSTVTRHPGPVIDGRLEDELRALLRWVERPDA